MSRNLRMLSLLAIALFAGTSLHAQICTPDTQFTEVGLYPDSLPTGIVGQPYEQVVHVVVPQDTQVVTPFGLLTVSLCELTLDSIPNLPAGMTYECSGGSCTWEIDHTPGVINRFCVKLSGTPTEGVSPDDSLLVFATVTPGAYNASTGNCDPLVGITLPDSLTTIEYKTALKLESGANGIAADLNPLKLSVFPNPGSGESTSISFTTTAAQPVAVTVYSVRGERLLHADQGVMAAGSHEVNLNTSQLPAGMYVIDVRAGATRQSSTWIRQ